MTIEKIAFLAKTIMRRWSVRSATRPAWRPKISQGKFEDSYRQDEAELVAACCDQDLDRFTDTIARWCHAVDLEAAQEDAAHRHRTRGVWIQQRLDGSGTGRLDLDPVASATLVQALDTMAGNLTPTTLQSNERCRNPGPTP